MGKPEYEELNRDLLHRAAELCDQLVPGGKIEGRSYVKKNATIGSHFLKKFSLKLDVGSWKDFANEKEYYGKDLISLTALAQDVSQSEAFRYLTEDFLSRPMPDDYRFKRYEAKGNEKFDIGRPPEGQVPLMVFKGWGKPIFSFCYRFMDGSPMYWVARYNAHDGTKQMRPWAWCNIHKRFVVKYWDAPRPIANLDKIARAPKAK